MNIKRYSLRIDDDDYYVACMEKDIIGVYVKYADHDSIVKKLEKRIYDLEQIVEILG